MTYYDGRKYRPRCAYCGIYLSYDADNYTPYGCANPEAPEPYDPKYLCKKHSEELYNHFIERFEKGNYHCGDYGKSEAEIKAAKKFNLVWIDSGGVGILSREENENWKHGYQYIKKEEYERLKALPYWGYCKKCNEPIPTSGGCKKCV